MSTKEQEAIIAELRKRVVPVKFGSPPQKKTKIDAQKTWIKAKAAGKTIDDDDLPTNYRTRPA